MARNNVHTLAGNFGQEGGQGFVRASAIAVAGWSVTRDASGFARPRCRQGLSGDEMFFPLIPDELRKFGYEEGRQFLRDSGGTGFWHEAHFMAGGMEAVYVDLATDVGFLRPRT